ncbi:MAG TPA: sigma-70 family RNA polymerase sigma factor [Candidatus Blautia faecigallinarum]|uniref:Sigma-70 family RNA polymerase sigma factor n=1 Tax=Candidatus Blautia faecigallinarum TaxID=2838488 RepID=A0A9D2DR83_9FIRM|nr:sigma-70 family RNA polymerase sigma factor [Candidatus Blautia faecigallinarum]
MEELKKPEVFAMYYQNVYKDMYRFALYTLKNAHDAEDVVGETVLDAYASVEKLRDPGAFRGWIFAILSNKCRKKLSEYCRKTSELPENLSDITDMEEGVLVREAFKRLKADDRLLLSMHIFGGYKSYEIGQILGMNDNTVRSRVSRSLKKLRSFLE